MEGLQYPDTVSGPLKVAEIQPVNDHEAKAILVAPAHPDFFGAMLDCNPEDVIASARTIIGVLGITFDPDISEIETRCAPNSYRGVITVPAIIKRLKEGILLDGDISQNLVVPDTVLGRLILKGPKRKRLNPQSAIEEILRKYPCQAGKKTPQVPDILDPVNGVVKYNKLVEIAQLRNHGVNVEDLVRFLHGIKDPKLLDPIIDRIRLEQGVRIKFYEGDSFIATHAGFAHPEAMIIYEDGEEIRPIGARAVYPREAVAEGEFLTRLQILKTVGLSEMKLPLTFLSMEERRTSIPGADLTDLYEYETDQQHPENYAKLDREHVPSYPSMEQIFRLLSNAQGGRKALFLKDNTDLRRALLGDGTLVESYSSVERVSPLNLLAALEWNQGRTIETMDTTRSHAELKLLESIGHSESGVLVCKYFPDADILGTIDKVHAHKVRSIVFQAPSYKKSESVMKTRDTRRREGSADFRNSLEEHIFIGPLEFVALRDFHKKYPHIRIIWSHPGAKRNLEFVDDGKVPMFAKPECVPYLENSETSVRVSFCGSSSAKTPQETEAAYSPEMELVKVYDRYAKRLEKKLVGINGGGPDVMERNGKQLQELGAISVASACDLGKAGQGRHDNWDAVLDQQGDDISFSLRENILLAGDIVHISAGGIGSIQELYAILAQNKLGIHDKILILDGKEYWGPQVEQLIIAGRKGNLRASMVKNLFLIDCPEEVEEILSRFSSNKAGFQQEREQLWNKVINGEAEIKTLEIVAN